MTIVVRGFLDGLLVTRGLRGGAAPAPAVLPEPRYAAWRLAGPDPRYAVWRLVGPDPKRARWK